MSRCIGHIFNGRLGGNWRCERCGMPYAERLRELERPYAGSKPLVETGTGSIGEADESNHD